MAARYLSPRRICVLVLVEMYVAELMPSDSILPVLSFITSQVMDSPRPVGPTNPDERWLKGELKVRTIASTAEYEQLLSRYRAAIGPPGRSLLDYFVHRLWTIDSVDALNGFFYNIQAVLRRSRRELRALAALGLKVPSPDALRLSRKSPFGSFVRRCRAEFDRLPFHGVSNLWKEFIKYRQTTAAYHRQRDPGFTGLSFDAVLKEGRHQWRENTRNVAIWAYGEMFLGYGEVRNLPVTTDEVEILVEFQIDRMQRTCFIPCSYLTFFRSASRLILPKTNYPLSSCTGYGVRVPAELQRHCQSLLQDVFVKPSLGHYVKLVGTHRHLCPAPPSMAFAGPGE